MTVVHNYQNSMKITRKLFV